MTQAEPIPEQIARFIDLHVESIEQLEILRVLGELSTRQWNSIDLATAAQIPPSDIVAHLTVLEKRGLLKIEVREPAMICRYGPATLDAEQQMDALLRFYRERPVTLIRAMYRRSNDPLKAFADSFRLRKES